MAKQHIILATMYDTSKSGGLSTYMINYAKGLRDQGIEVTFIDERSIPFWKRLLMYKLLRNGLYVLKKDWGMRWYFHSAQFMMRAAILPHVREGSIIQCQDVVALCAIKDSVPKSVLRLLVVQGDLTNMCLSDSVITPGGKAEKISLEIERAAYTEADGVATCDTRLYNHVRDFVKRDVTAIKNFVDEEEFTPPSASEQEKLRRKFKLSNFTVLVPRRLIPKNGVVYAAQAMALLKKEEVTLLFAGNGAQRAELQAIIDKEGMGDKVIILGDVPHDRIVEYYKAVDAVMIPSVNSKGVIEATSISCLEGMGCEKPVIVSNIGGLAELITNGKNGLSVKEKDSKGLANAILKLKKSPALCKKLGKNARTFVVKNNSIKSQTKKYLQFIKGVRRK